MSMRMWMFALAMACGCASAMDAKELQRELDRAIARGDASFTIPPGTYHFSPDPLLIQSARDMVIEGSGAELWFKPNVGVFLNSSVNISIHNLFIDFEPHPFVQGRILEVSHVGGGGMLLTVDVEEGYPELIQYVNQSYYGMSTMMLSAWNPRTRAPYPWTYWQVGPDRVRQREERGHYVFNISYAYSLHPGDLWALNNRMGFSWNVANCTRIQVENVTLYGGAFSGVAEYSGEGGNTYRRVRILRRGTRLLATNGDMFHSQGVKNGPLVENCEITYGGDDFFNVHSTALIAWRRPAPASLYLIDPHLFNGRDNTHYGTCATLPDIPPGSHLSFYSLNKAASLTPVYAGAKLTSLTLVTDPKLVAEAAKAPEEMNAAPYDANILSFLSHLYEANFSAPLPEKVTPILLANVDDWEAGGAIIRNNVFHVTCCNLGRWKSTGGSITNNNFSNATLHNLEVTPLQHWLEGALSIKDVLIEGNTIVGSGAQPFHTSNAVNVTIRNNTVIP